MTPWILSNRSNEGALWYYRSLSDAFRVIYPSPLANELERVVLEIEHSVELNEGPWKEYR